MPNPYLERERLQRRIVTLKKRAAPATKTDDLFGTICGYLDKLQEQIAEVRRRVERVERSHR